MTKAKTTDERISFWDTFNSMTGYDEKAVEEAFGIAPGQLVKETLIDKSRPLGLEAMRAMLFVAARHAGTENAFDEVMNLSRTEVNDRFLSDLEDAEDAIPEEPDTELGKDDSPSA